MAAFKQVLLLLDAQDSHAIKQCYGHARGAGRHFRNRGCEPALGRGFRRGFNWRFVPALGRSAFAMPAIFSSEDVKIHCVFWQPAQLQAGVNLF